MAAVISMRTVPTVESLRAQFIADFEAGALTRRSTGRAVGTIEHAGYLVARVDGGTHRVHRMLWAMAHGEWPTGEIDHINGVRTDNRLANLRDVPKALNAQNLRGAKAQSATVVLGVSYDRSRGKFIAQITANRRYFHLGRFDTKEAASAAYLAAKRRLHEGCTL